MQLLKKFIPVVLLASIALMPVLFSAGFIIRQYSIKWEMRERLEQQHLQTITIPVDDIHWIDEGEELLVQGELFDVKTMTVSNGIAELRGLFDKAEDILFDQLNTFALEQEEDGPGTSSESCFSISYGCDKHFFPDTTTLNTAAQTGLLLPVTERISTRAIAVLTPPPNC
jgi:hypothetical protein